VKFPRTWRRSDKPSKRGEFPSQEIRFEEDDRGYFHPAPARIGSLDLKKGRDRHFSRRRAEFGHALASPHVFNKYDFR
jgi:hypothetical protein